MTSQLNDTEKLKPCPEVKPQSECEKTAAQTDQHQAGVDKPVAKKTKNSIKPFCSICIVSLTSQSQAEVHFSGEKHRRTLALKTANAGVIKAPEQYCGVCHVPFNSPLIAQAHYAGAKHEKRVKLAQVNPCGDTPNVQSQLFPSTQPPPPPPPSTQPPPAAPLNMPHLLTCPPPGPAVLNNGQISGVESQQNANQSQGKVLQPGSLLFCSFCNISVNSQAQMDAHRSGSKHQNKVKGLSVPPAKKFKPNTPAGMTQYNPGYNNYIPGLQKSFVFGGSTGENYGQTA
ncbi:unnamed protein product [Lymnaea stagnalis]|uniref:Uncharacterized protein n=1 Tax=Lymnaea stagnalis TaxID=6523 RepID=A0AAV2IJV8_LYMST